jgi:hypothetical protein
MSSLEKIIFLDEAYSLTTWEQIPGKEDERRLSGYSGEAVTEIVSFLSQRTGAVCFIAAGYEDQMMNNFLPANAGLERRFPQKCWLSDYSPEQLVNIYLTALAAALSDPPPSSRLTRSTTQSFFTDLALAFLTDILASARSQSTGSVQYPLLNRVFEAQAGAMSTLANVTAVLVASSQRRGQIGLSDTGQDTWAVSFTDIYDILSTLLQQQLGPKAGDALEELQGIATANGWLVSGAWRVPPERVLSKLSERVRKVRKT